MSSTDVQDDPWGRRWCHAPRHRAPYHPAGLGGSRLIPRAMREPVVEGIISMLLAALLFASGASIARFASVTVNTFALVFWTNLFCFLIMGVWCLLRPMGGVATRRLGLHFLRSIFTYGALLTYFYAIATISFANAVVLQSLGPVFVPILALVVLRKLSDRHVWIGVVVSFAGVALIIPPDRIGMSLGDIAALLAAMGGAAAALVIWSLAATEPPQRQMFYFSLFALMFAVIPLPWAWQVPSAIELFQIGLIAAFIIIGQYFYARAFTLSPGDKVNTWSYMSIVFAAIIGRIVWNEPILVTTCAGAALIVFGARLASRKLAERT
jgi:drug/metabolite transporter (DMT)-like permease